MHANFSQASSSDFDWDSIDQTYLFERFGITRVGDLTGLDDLDLPTWFACRPNSRSLSVSQGKGLSHNQARISAIMEAIEGAVAEQPKRLVERFASTDEMLRCGLDIVPLRSIMRVQFEDFDDKVQRGWVPGISYDTGNVVYAPYELVGIDMRANIPWDRRTFVMTSVGLAAGTTLASAILHAVYELIENDATAALEMFGTTRTTFEPIEHSPGDNPDLDGVVHRLRDTGATIRFGDCTSDIALPVLCAFIKWPNSKLGHQFDRVCAGFACRHNPHEAALAALLEAAQSRITNIAGARDDIPSSVYTAQHRLFETVARTSRSLSDPFSFNNQDPDSQNQELLANALQTLQDSVGGVCIFPLDPCDSDIRVVRVLANDLETVPRTGLFRMGSRSFGRLLNQQGTLY